MRPESRGDVGLWSEYDNEKAVDWESPRLLCFSGNHSMPQSRNRSTK
jgi:hypothetical protein